MKTMKKTLSVFLVLLMALCLLPMAAQATDETVYTVTLTPGEGIGEDIIYRSDEGEIAADFRSAQNGQFYYENNGRMGFRFVYDECPAGWTAPDGYVFNSFTGVSGGSAGNFNTLTKEDTVFVADWILSGDPSVSITFSETDFDYSSFNEDGVLTLTMTVSDIDFGPNAKVDSCLNICLENASVQNGRNHIDFQTIFAESNSNYVYIYSTAPRSFEVTLKADPETLSVAAPMTYEGNLAYSVKFISLEGNDYYEKLIIPVTLTIPPAGGISSDGNVPGAVAPGTGASSEAWIVRLLRIILDFLADLLKLN